ncbi:MAG: SurA N-terminal domain-containing protein [Bacteroidales bacterium]|nr:SurA N-terminal domain-containing protein [Bacteroidales bacterium]
MATLEKIRSRSILLISIIGLALFAFIIGDFLNSGSTYFGQSRLEVVKVNDKAVKIDKFQEKVDDLAEIYKAQTGNSQVSEEMMEQLRQSVFESIVRENIIDEQAQKLGLSVTSKELFELATGANPHPIIAQNMRMFYDENGNFDRESFLQFLNSINAQPENAQQAAQVESARKYWLFWENRIKYSQLEMKYTTLLQKAVVVNELEAQLAFDNRKPSVDIAYVLKPYAAIADSTVKVSDAEISALYKKEKENYKQKEENRDIKYVVFSVKPSEADFDKVKEWMEKQKEEFTTAENIEDLLNTSSDVPYMNYRLAAKDVDADFRDFAFASPKGAVTDLILSNGVYKMARVLDAKVNAPDSVRVRHILVYAENDEATAALADSILGAIKGGADFAQLAEKYSRNTSTAANGGEIGWLKEQDLDKDMIQPCFYGSDKVFTVKTTNGTHVMEVEEKTANVEKVHLAILERAVEASSNTFSTYYNEATNFVNQNKTADKFKAAAEEAGYSVREMSGMTVNTPRLGQIKNTRQVVRWAFEAKEGTVSDVFSCDDDFVVALLDKVHPKGYRSQADVADVLKSSIVKEKKVEMLTADLNAAGNDLQQVASSMQTSVDTLRGVNFAQPRVATGFEPNLVGLAPFKAVGEKATVEAQNGVMLFQVLDKTESTASFDAANEAAQLEAKYQYVIPQAYYEVLKDQAEVKDNRARFY